MIKPALADSKVVICDRYVDSTTAYQGYGRELRLGAVKTINTVATFGVMPDMTFFVQVPIARLIERRKLSGQPIDRMESSGRAFYEKINAGYLAMAKEEPKRIVVIDGDRTIEEVRDDIWKRVADHLPRT